MESMMVFRDRMVLDEAAATEEPDCPLCGQRIEAGEPYRWTRAIYAAGSARPVVPSRPRHAVCPEPPRSATVKSAPGGVHPRGAHGRRTPCLRPHTRRASC